MPSRCFLQQRALSHDEACGLDLGKTKASLFNCIQLFSKVVSERFNRRSEREKQDLIHEILRDTLGADAQVVSLAMAYGTDEL